MEPVCAWKSLDVDFSFFVSFWCFWVLFDPCLRPCLRNMLFLDVLVGVWWVICEFELKTFYLEKSGRRS